MSSQTAQEEASHGPPNGSPSIPFQLKSAKGKEPRISSSNSGLSSKGGGGGIRTPGACAQRFSSSAWIARRRTAPPAPFRVTGAFYHAWGVRGRRRAAAFRQSFRHYGRPLDGGPGRVRTCERGVMSSLRTVRQRPGPILSRYVRTRGRRVWTLPDGGGRWRWSHVGHADRVAWVTRSPVV
jgi:hypothetical protein